MQIFERNFEFRGVNI